MNIISTGFIVGAMLNALISILYLTMPLPWAWKMGALFKRPITTGSGWDKFCCGVSAWYVWIWHLGLILALYYFMGMAWSAHLSVISFELIWHFLTANLLIAVGRRHSDASLA